MKFKYLGDKKDMVVFGYDFSDGQTPDVTDEKIIQKLTDNSHFEAVDGEEKPKPAKEKKGKEPVVAPEPAADAADDSANLFDGPGAEA
jgi:hypothetical protein